MTQKVPMNDGSDSETRNETFTSPDMGHSNNVDEVASALTHTKSGCINQKLEPERQHRKDSTGKTAPEKWNQNN